MGRVYAVAEGCADRAVLVGALADLAVAERALAGGARYAAYGIGDRKLLAVLFQDHEIAALRLAAGDAAVDED